jgi:hypothetical protein
MPRRRCQAGRHLRRYVDVRGLPVVLGRIDNVSAERVQEDRNAVAPTNLLGPLRTPITLLAAEVKG